MFDVTLRDGKKEKFEGCIVKFDKNVDYYDDDENDISITKLSPKMLLERLYIRKESAKLLIENPNQIWAKVGEKTISKIDPRIGEVISFDAIVVEFDLDNHTGTKFYLKSLSKIKTQEKGCGQKFTEFWSSIDRNK